MTRRANERSVSPVGEPLMTRSAGNLISGEVVRNKRSAQWAVAPIENAELSGAAGSDSSLLARNERRARSKREQRRLSAQT